MNIEPLLYCEIMILKRVGEDALSIILAQPLHTYSLFSKKYQYLNYEFQALKGPSSEELELEKNLINGASASLLFSNSDNI